jgi:hypothetical protein
VSGERLRDNLIAPVLKEAPAGAQNDRVDHGPGASSRPSGDSDPTRAMTMNRGSATALLASSRCDRLSSLVPHPRSCMQKRLPDSATDLSVLASLRYLPSRRLPSRHILVLMLKYNKR